MMCSLVHFRLSINSCSVPNLKEKEEKNCSAQKKTRTPYQQIFFYVCFLDILKNKINKKIIILLPKKTQKLPKMSLFFGISNCKLPSPEKNKCHVVTKHFMKLKNFPQE